MDSLTPEKQEAQKPVPKSKFLKAAKNFKSHDQPEISQAKVSWFSTPLGLGG